MLYYRGSVMKMDRSIRHKQRVAWSLYAIAGLFCFVVLGLWLALLLGARTTGIVIPGNPITAVFELLLGQIAWPSNWSTLLVVVEAVFLMVLTWQIRRVVIDRAARRHVPPGHVRKPHI
jgi:hypothetical protein